MHLFILIALVSIISFLTLYWDDPERLPANQAAQPVNPGAQMRESSSLCWSPEQRVPWSSHHVLVLGSSSSHHSNMLKLHVISHHFSYQLLSTGTITRNMGILMYCILERGIEIFQRLTLWALMSNAHSPHCSPYLFYWAQYQDILSSGITFFVLITW